MQTSAPRKTATMKPVIVWFLVFGPQSAWAQGITNPAGGGLIPITFHIFIGLVPLAYVFLSLAFGERTTKTPVFSIRNLLILVFLIIGFIEISISDHHEYVLYLYLEMLLIIVGMIFLLFRGIVFQVLAIGGVGRFRCLAEFPATKANRFSNQNLHR